MKAMFNPGSIAVIGRDRQDDAPAALLVRNLIDAGFKGPVLPVNPHRHAVSGVLAYRNVACLPEKPELAILTTPLAEGVELIDELGAKGVQAVLLLTDESALVGREYAALQGRILTAAHRWRLRILGPDRLGMAIPVHRINASLSRTPLLRGSISVVTQSSTMMHAIIHWGHLRNIGFSHLISLGDQWDVDCSHLLDYLAREAQTRAILLYLENVRNPRLFLSAARAAARVKPVIALKPRTANGHGADEAIFDAAIGRVGMLRVDTLEHWFNAVKALALSPSPQRNRLFILGNSHSIGLVAGDMLRRESGELATISPETRAALADIAPPGYVSDNPVDLGDRAGFREYDRALELLLQEPGASGILIVHVPMFPDLDRESARAIVARAARSRRPIMVSWVGATPGSPAWQTFQEAGIATYRTPEEAVWSCLRLAEYARNQALLMETPSSIPEAFTPDTMTARQIIANALAAGQDPLNIQSTRALLTAYRIPLADTRFAATPEEAAQWAVDLGGPVVLKIFSPRIANRADVGGVALALEGPQDVLAAAQAMLRRVQTLAPDAVVEGFAVQPMLSRGDAYEIAIGVRTGREFKAGPVLFFGHGGMETQVINDLAYALPPLNMHLARELMSRTRIYAKLRANPGRAVDLDALAMTLLKVSQMVIDLGELVELDINPLWVSRNGVLALSARVRIAPSSGPATERLAIRPYPKELEQPVELPDGRSLLLRPILPEDEPALQAMVGRMPPEDVRWRFFQSFKELPRDMAARLTQLDYDREMTLILTEPEVAGKATMWGLVSLSASPDREQAEYAIALDRGMAGCGLGALLMRCIIAYARQRGIREIVGEVLDDNEPMLRLCQALGFTQEAHWDDDPHLIRVCLPLSDVV
ncbi:MAG: bifunctional acetate--CoA ligase family protein/GNAT family N-acetyltransferase [Candidatus Competibacteraceae bacterium]|nr:bifunctional acetate--CoA ligase family protein/GNAT family N-acetyltransferase [Candidatus Competibacteraceae bacterium]HRY15105.1 bifunctional acetate--CoA ligase family protein/GNAT family N-acetyltransferase [Candidatus Competibacteraceae bacterium]